MPTSLSAAKTPWGATFSISISRIKRKAEYRRCCPTTRLFMITSCFCPHFHHQYTLQVFFVPPHQSMPSWTKPLSPTKLVEGEIEGSPAVSSTSCVSPTPITFEGAGKARSEEHT